MSKFGQVCDITYLSYLMNVYSSLHIIYMKGLCANKLNEHSHIVFPVCMLQFPFDIQWIYWFLHLNPLHIYTVQPVRKTTMVDNRDFLLFIWLELNDQRPTCSTRPRPLVFIDLKCFLLFIGLVWATTICPHFSVSESYLILRVWFEFSPLGKLSPLLNQSEKSTPTDTPRQSTEALIGWRVSHWRRLRR